MERMPAISVRRLVHFAATATTKDMCSSARSITAMAAGVEWNMPVIVQQRTLAYAATAAASSSSSSFHFAVTSRTPAASTSARSSSENRGVSGVGGLFAGMYQPPHTTTATLLSRHSDHGSQQTPCRRQAFATKVRAEPVGASPGYQPVKWVNVRGIGSADLPKRVGCVAVKCGMTQMWDTFGTRIPLTVLWLDGCEVTQVKTTAREGYNALQVGAGNRRAKQVTKQVRGHFESKGLNIKRRTAEFRVSESELLPVGSQITAQLFAPGQYLDVTGTTIGKGFQGVMKRHGFGGGNASHGASKSHRTLGSTGQCQDPGRVFKGKKMPGRMGGDRRTVQNVWLYAIDPVRNLLYVKGQVPGHKGNFVLVKDAVRAINFDKPYLITATPRSAKEMLEADVLPEDSRNRVGGGVLLVADVGKVDPFA